MELCQYQISIVVMRGEKTDLQQHSGATEQDKLAGTLLILIPSIQRRDG